MTHTRNQPLRDVDAVLVDVGGTLLEEANGATATSSLVARPLPGVALALAQLRSRYRVAAVTDTAVMREADVRAHLDECGLGQYVETIVTSRDVGVTKPNPASVLEACRRLGVEPVRALLVGDRPSDRDAALAAGAPFVATDRGLGDALNRFAVWQRSASATATRRVAPLVDGTQDEARTRHLSLTKPPGSLGRLETLGVQLAGIAGRCPPPEPAPVHVGVFAADHGVVDAGVTPWPQSVTAQMVANISAGGAAINALARQLGATVHVVDVGVATDLPPLAGVRTRTVRRGTASIAHEAAMSSAEAIAAIDVGAELAQELTSSGAGCLVTGDMGIGNTTPSAALIAALAGAEPDLVTGRGTGIDDETLERKRRVVADAATRVSDWLDPVCVLSEIGGLEIAALAGFILGGVAARIPVVIDGVIAAAALLVATSLAPDASSRCIAGHRSVEPGSTAALDHLGLVPVLDLEMRLGEGTGGCLAIPVVQAAARVLRDMATFEEAEVSGRN